MGARYYAGEYIKYPCLSKTACITSHTSNKCNLSMSSIIQFDLYEVGKIHAGITSSCDLKMP